MKLLIIFLICGVYGELPVTTVLPELRPETLTDLPKETVGNFGAEMTMQPRQNDVEYLIEIGDSSDEQSPVEEVSPSAPTTTLHFTLMACTGDHMQWMSCGPRCFQTCAFQPRGSRQSRAICASASSTNCYPGCFCASGYVRLNEKCVLPVDCPRK